MLMVSVPKADIEALDTIGTQVRINGEEVTLKRQGDKLFYGDEVRIIFESVEQDLEVRGLNGLHPCISFFAGEVGTDCTFIGPSMCL